MVDIGVAGFQRNRTAKTVFRQPGIAQAHVDKPAQVVGFGKTGVGGERLLDLVQCNGRLSFLKIPHRKFEPDTRAPAAFGLVGIGNQVRFGGALSRGARASGARRQIQASRHGHRQRQQPLEAPQPVLRDVSHASNLLDLTRGRANGFEHDCALLRDPASDMGAVLYVTRQLPARGLDVITARLADRGYDAGVA